MYAVHTLQACANCSKMTSYSEPSNGMREKFDIGKSMITTLKRKTKSVKLDQAVYLWFVQKRSIGMPISERFSVKN